MANVKVWNDNKYDFKSMFKGEPIHIKAGEFKIMEFYEAHEFKGDYHPIQLDANNQPLPESFKMIRIEKEGEESTHEAETMHYCMSCKHKSPSPEELEAHIKVRHADQARVVIDEVDQEMKKKGKKSA